MLYIFPLSSHWTECNNSCRITSHANSRIKTISVSDFRDRTHSSSQPAVCGRVRATSGCISTNTHWIPQIHETLAGRKKIKVRKHSRVLGSPVRASKYINHCFRGEGVGQSAGSCMLQSGNNKKRGAVFCLIEIFRVMKMFFQVVRFVSRLLLVVNVTVNKWFIGKVTKQSSDSHIWKDVTSNHHSSN